MQHEEPKTPGTPKRRTVSQSPMPLLQQSPLPQDSECPLLTSFVFPDLRALYTLKLHEIPSLAFCEVTLFGFEVYMVEQWVLERKHSTIITSYTGNTQDIVHAVKFALPESPQFWPLQFRKYYDELIQFSAPKLTEDGTLFVSTSSQIPSALNLLHLECGDLRKIWDVFKVNVDLKRLHCGGRSALLLCEPSSASCEKFAQLYNVVSPTTTSQELENTSLTHAVVEMITLVQISLTYFDLLDPRYKDGILCSYTEEAIKNWWILYGSIYLRTDRPKHEGPLGPTTVAGLVSLVLTVFFKLTVINCMSSKEPFDEEAFHGGIYLFQKKYSLLKGNNASISVLDPIVLAKLFEVTPKVSNTDIFKLKKVVKSTVQDITGKGNPMQLANGILTTDLGYLAKNVHGGILCFLWRGKNTKQSVNKRHAKRKFTDTVFHQGDPEEEILKSNVFASKRESEEWSDSPDAVLTQSNNSQELGFGKAATNAFLLDSEDNNREVNSREDAFKIDRDVYESELHRRPSIPYLPEDIGMMQMEYKNLPWKVNQNINQCRRHSYSIVQDAMEPWTSPFEPSLVRIARDALKFEREVARSRDNDQNEVSNHDPITPHLVNLRENDSELHSKLGELEQLRDQLVEKRSIVLSDISELDSLASKLKYDVRLLDNRTRDVEERILQFGSKLNSIAALMEDKRVCQLMTSSFYSNPKKLVRYEKEILERAGRFKSQGVILNLWKHAKNMSSPILGELHHVWLYFCDKFVPQGHFKK